MRFRGNASLPSAGTGIGAAGRRAAQWLCGSATFARARAGSAPGSAWNRRFAIPDWRQRGPWYSAAPGFSIRDCAPLEKSKPVGFGFFRPCGAWHTTAETPPGPPLALAGDKAQGSAGNGIRLPAPPETTEPPDLAAWRPDSGARYR